MPFDLFASDAEILRFNDSLHDLVLKCRFSNDANLRLTYSRRILIKYLAYNDLLPRFLTLEQLRLKPLGWLRSNVYRIEEVKLV